MTIARSAWMALALVALAACAPVPHPEAPTPPPAPPAEVPGAAPPGFPAATSDQDFINLATGLGRSEIGMGRLAHGKGAANAVRHFALHMVVAYGVTDQRLKLLARHLKLDVAPPPDEPPPPLVMASGPDFDRHYLGLVIAAHQNMIALYESEAGGGQDPRAKHLAKSLLPLLHYHLHKAETISHELGL